MFWQYTWTPGSWASQQSFQKKYYKESFAILLELNDRWFPTGRICDLILASRISSLHRGQDAMMPCYHYLSSPVCVSIETSVFHLDWAYCHIVDNSSDASASEFNPSGNWGAAKFLQMTSRYLKKYFNTY